MLNLRCRQRIFLACSFQARSASNASSVVLRPYQKHCIDACLDALRSGASRLGVSLPTGSGKTTIFISLLSRIAAKDEDCKRSLIIVNGIELARQSASQVRRLFPDWTVEIEQGLEHQASGLADVTVATYQTLRNSNRIAKFNPRRFKVVIVDEAHHAAAPSYRKLLSLFHVDIREKNASPKPELEHNHRVPIIGFSATFSRHDELALGSIFERIVYHRDFLQMIEENWLCDVRLTSVSVDMDLTAVSVNKQSADFNSKILAVLVNKPSMNEIIVKTWVDRAVNCKSTLIFCIDVAHVHALTAAFRAFGIDARCLSSRTPTLERKQLIASFKAGEFPVLINCTILTEGADIPNIDCVILARPTRSLNLFTQMIGRGMRLSPDTGKEDCLIIDFVDSTDRVAGVVSLPSLLGLDPREVDIQNVSLKKLKERVTEGIRLPQPNLDPGDPMALTFQELGGFSDLLDSIKPETVWKVSTNAWVYCGEDHYVLEVLFQGFIQIMKSEKSPDFVVQWVVQTTIPPEEILVADTMLNAIRGADSYVEKRFWHARNGFLRSAPWRERSPTPAQVAMIEERFDTSVQRGTEAAFAAALFSDSEENGLRSRAPLSKQMVLQHLQGMTKGEVCDIITRFIHSPQGVSKCRLDAEQRLKARQLREHGSVGPVYSFMQSIYNLFRSNIK